MLKHCLLLHINESSFALICDFVIQLEFIAFGSSYVYYSLVCSKQKQMGKPSKASKAQTQKNEKILENADVTLSRVYQKNTIQNTVLSWRVSNYEKLRRNVIHLQLYETIDIKCVLRLFKTVDSLFVCVSGGTLPKRTEAELSVLDEVELVTVKKTAEGIGECVFAAQFENEQFLGPDFQFLRHGILTISFKYAHTAPLVDYTESNMDDPEVIRDLDELCYDLKIMYLEALYSDFLIHVQNYSFKTHKFILRARSKYFDRLFENDPDVKDHTLDDLPGIVHQVFLYMYSTELQEMDLLCMLRVYELACFLDVSTLRSRCLQYFKKEINEQNYEVIVSSCKKTDSVELKNLVVYFLKTDLPHVSIVEVFKREETGP